MSPRKTRMNPPTSTSSTSSTPSISSAPSTSSAPSISKPLEESDNEENTSQQIQLAAQAERIVSLELLVRELIDKQSEQSNISSSSSNVTSAANRLPVVNANDVIREPPVHIETRTVPKKNYLVTSASVSKVFLENRINDTTTDSFIRINMIRGAMTTAGLQYMLDGNRKKPRPTPTNKFGYTERSITSAETIDEETGLLEMTDILIDEDDCFCYDYDRGRLYSAILEIFGSTLYYLVPREIREADGRGMFNKIMAHLNGQRASDADSARHIYNTYKMNENLTFKMEHAKFSVVFKNLEYAQKRELTSAEKLQFLGPKIIHDKRVGLKDVMLQATIHEWDYEKTVGLLIKLNSGLAEGDQTVKMAAVSYPKSNSNSNSQYTSTSAPTVKSPKYCFLWNETGTCRFNESCRYEHIRDPNHATVARERNQQRENDNNNNKSNNTTTSSQPITKNNRSQSDNTNSSKFKSNYKGKNPRSQMKVVHSHDENVAIKIMNTNSESEISSSTFDPLFSSWGNVSEQPYTPDVQSADSIKLEKKNRQDNNK
jgi:hypothetical protein